MRPKHVQGFDVESGLVFQETTQSASPRCTCPRGLYDSSDSTGHQLRRSDGVSRLRRMAIRRIASNAESLTVEGLRALPIHILEQVLHHLRQRRRVNLRVWTLIAAAVSLDNRPPLTFACTCSHPMLTSVLRRVSRPDLLWLADLTLSHSMLTTQDFMAVSDCPNLRSITIEVNTGDAGKFSYNVLRAWAQAARECGALPALAALAILNYPISWRLFDLINSFLRLDTLLVSGQEWDDQAILRAWDVGWTTATVSIPRDYTPVRHILAEELNLPFRAFNQASLCLVFGDSRRSESRRQPTVGTRDALLLTRNLDEVANYQTAETLSQPPVPSTSTSSRIPRRKAVALEGMLKELTGEF